MARSPGTPRELHVLKLLPNLVSILALCAGLTAIRYALVDQYQLAILLIGIAAALDGLDGRLARMLNSESAIGAELDSLCDFVNFGVAPAFVLYLWGMHDEASLGWIAVLLYAVCAMLRLARFNVGNKLAVDEVAEKASFIGIPSPAGAMLSLVPMYVSFVFDQRFEVPSVIVSLWMVGIGALMISSIRTPSLKRVTIAPDYARYFLVLAVLGVAALLTYPWVTLLALSWVYLAGILMLWLRKKTLPQ